MPLRCGSAWPSFSHQLEAFVVRLLELAYILIISFSLELHKNFASVLLHTNLIIYCTTFRSTFSHASLAWFSLLPHLISLIELSPYRYGIISLSSTNNP